MSSSVISFHPHPGRSRSAIGGRRIDVVSDALGRFAADDVEPGPVSLRCHVGDRVVETDWFLV